MKKLLIILAVSGLAISASAQRFSHGGGRYYGRSRVVISTGIYAPYYPYGYYGYPFYAYPYGYMERPTRLELKIEDIRNDYQDKIWSARHDKSLSRKERKETVHRLKQERDQAIIDARRNYYKR
ncbi:MAG: hypothetical protein Q8941_14900 [Bacteroidota bacterium]|nr:hypothetical protein [Bacteroidota bacterium]